MNTGGRAACALVAVAVGLSGCDGSTADSPQTTVPVTTTARKPMFEDGGLRDVRATSGRALG
jgi:predicted component of type VI protein secretion system